MSNIIIGFSKPNRWKIFAWLIQSIDKTEYSHVYVKWYSSSLDRNLIYQASGFSVNFEGTEHFNTHALVVEEYELDISEEIRRNVIQYAIDNAGISYGIKQIFGIGIVKLVNIFGKKINNPFSDNKKTEICAELAARILQDVVKQNIPYDLDTIDPKELNEFIKTLPNCRKI